MADIPAKLVMQLRAETGAPMMDCKRALQETSSDFEEAKRWLRERGMAQAAKRADRSTNEGLVGYRIEGAKGTIVAVGCETEPVSKNDDFRAFARDVLREVHDRGESAVDVLEERRVELTAKLGENIQVAFVRRMTAAHGETFVSYVHPPAHKIGVLLKVKGGSPELPLQLAMHISFARPTYESRDQVPADLVAAEREILQNSDEVQSKPENVREKIVEGMLNKRFYAESVLGEQTWIHDTNLTVAKALEQGGLELVEYAWFSLG
jgi:elongation factor Ts